MKILMLVAAVVTLVQGRPEAGYSYSKPLSRPIVVPDEAGNEIADVQKHVYVHAPAPEPVEHKPQKPIIVAPPQKHYKLLFIKSPTPPTPTTPLIPVIPQNEEKTLVYVLNKKPEEQPKIVIPTAAPTQPVKPQVYYIKYNTKKEKEISNSGNNKEETVHKSLGSELGGLTGGKNKIESSAVKFHARVGNGKKYKDSKQSATSTNNIYKVPKKTYQKTITVNGKASEGNRNTVGKISSYVPGTGRQFGRNINIGANIKVADHNEREKLSDTGRDYSGSTTSIINNNVIQKSISSASFTIPSQINNRGREFIDHTPEINFGVNHGQGHNNGIGASSGGYGVTSLINNNGREYIDRTPVNNFDVNHRQNIGHGHNSGIGLLKGGMFDSNTGYNDGSSGNYNNEFGNDDSKFSIIQKHVYVHVPPPEPTEYRPRKPITFAPPQTHYKIIFIKAPTPPTPTAPLIPVIPQNEEKTLVYVLHKKPEEQPEIIFPTAAPTQPAKPEVYFIRYKTEKEGDIDTPNPSDSYGSPVLQNKSH